ncbi:PTS sugar transporter subunit IIB [Caviibacter abscessus]|uniref:PTS maltose transporter subunit IIBC n=1 Tax=Caviibacter abscessus TaxID=1766719 RepID=UPI00082BF4F9|nr:PTS maltose transporter subunit IIBC [Caviibacter abscessus]
MKIVTICGNGIGSSLMCKLKIEEILEEESILGVVVESSDFNSALSKGAGLYVSALELIEQLPKEVESVVIRSYVNKKKIKEDVIIKIRELLK